MKHLDEYRDPAQARRLADAIARTVTRPRTVMEVCGGQTHAIMRFGIDELLPPDVALVHGPGCPVCVTPTGLIDQAIELARRPGVTLCSFGDMMRVPGSREDLLGARATGAEVRMVYAPLDAARLAQSDPTREVVFFGVGFETTAPANALAVEFARRAGLRNFSLLSAHVLVPPAIEAILTAPACRVNGFLAAGHVCTIMGYGEYEPLAARHGAPIVITGFEPIDILQGLLHCLRQLEAGTAQVENAYGRAVTRAGNATAQALLAQVFQTVDRAWRGLGVIPKSGLELRPPYVEFDAARRYGLGAPVEAPAGECIAGEVLQGLRKPHECPAFGTRCTPATPLGAPMVSAEGACAAYHRYRRHA